MHMQLTCAATLVLARALGGGGVGNDHRLLLITREQLVDQIRSSRSTAEQETLVCRAVVSGMASVAYDQYTRRWREHPGNPRTNLLRGEAALAYFEQGPVVAGKPSPISPSLEDSLLDAATRCLREAHKLDVSSASAAREYGYVLWQYGRKMKEGAALVRHAVDLDPSDPVGRLVLGYLYFNRASNVYDPDKAQAELQKALRLDPSYASPHRLLSGLYRSVSPPRPNDAAVMCPR